MRMRLEGPCDTPYAQEEHGAQTRIRNIRMTDALSLLIVERSQDMNVLLQCFFARRQVETQAVLRQMSRVYPPS